MRRYLVVVVLVVLALAACGAEPAPTAPSVPTAPPAPTAAPPAEASIGDTWVRPADGMVMVYVPAGEFRMGSTDWDVVALRRECAACDPQWIADEQPQHTVTLDAFWIDRTEVTNAQYRLCVEAGACREEPRFWDDDRYNDSDRPVVGVSWDDARKYAAWAGGRLPTEAEWEKAACGTGGQQYPWGYTFDATRLNFCDGRCPHDWKDARADDAYPWTAPVGSYPDGASLYGALDMVGNVYEWVADWYGEDYYENSPDRNPQGPDSGGGQRVVRGGSWADVQWSERCAHRTGHLDYLPLDDLGFRLVVDAGASEP